jgi:hypothetical protein
MNSRKRKGDDSFQGGEIGKIFHRTGRIWNCTIELSRMKTVRY